MTKRFFFLQLPLIFIVAQSFILACSAVFNSYSGVTCLNRAWSVRYNDTTELNVKFQTWLFAYQNLCHDRIVYFPDVTNSGIGSSINWAARDFIIAIEKGQIYRPRDTAARGWIWADHDPMKCSLPLRSIDCFTKPVSPCHFHNDLYSTAQQIKMRHDLAALPIDAGCDSCGMGGDLKKPLQWVLGHILNFMLRYDDKVQAIIDHKIDVVFNNHHDHLHNKTNGHHIHTHHENSTINHQHLHQQNISHYHIDSHEVEHKQTETEHFNLRSRRLLDENTLNSEASVQYTTIGVHIRGGLPDGGRAVINESVYMHYVDLIAEQLKLQNKPVKLVFLCSHTQELNVISAEHMTRTFPRQFRYSVLPHLSTGAGESEYAVRDNVLNNRELVVEFYTDLEILAKVDYFIGSSSNMYTLITAVRIARGLHRHNNQSCYISSFKEPQHTQYPLYCEGDQATKDLWRGTYGGFDAKTESANWYNPDDNNVV